MGIQINGQTDTISATDGGLSVSGQELTGVTDINASGIGTFGSGLVLTGGDITLGTGTTISSPASDTFTVSTNGSERIRVDSSGRLAVGTTPAAKLDIKMSGATRTDGVIIRRSSNDNHQFGLWTDSGEMYVDAITDNPASGEAGKVVFRRSQNTGATFTESARIDGSGRLLVGTTNSTNNVNGNTKIASIIAGNGSSGGFDLTGYVGPGSSAYTPSINLQRSIGTTDGSMTAVGTAPHYIGQINFRGSDGTNFATGASIHAITDNNSVAWSSGDNPGALVFSTTADSASSPTERMRITSGGYLKATSDNGNLNYYGPASTLHHFQNNGTEFTQGVVNAHGSAPYGISIVFAGAAPDNNTSMFLQCVDNAGGGTVRMRIYADGDVWTSDAGVLTSDVTLKRDIADVSPKLADVMNLRVRNFCWEEDYHPNKKDKKLIGFIAQEFEEVFPGLVSEHKIRGGEPVLDENGNETGEMTPEVFKKGIKEAKLVPILVKAFQEAVDRIETLEAKVAALETP